MQLTIPRRHCTNSPMITGSIDPGSLAGKTPEVTTLFISATAKPVPPQATTPSHPMLPLRAHNPEAPHPLPVSSRAKTRDPYPPISMGTPKGSNRAQPSSTSTASANTFSHQMKLALAQGGAIRGGLVSLPAYISTASGYRSRLNGREDTGGNRSAHQCHCKASPTSNHNALTTPCLPSKPATLKPHIPSRCHPGRRPGTHTPGINGAHQEAATEHNLRQLSPQQTPSVIK